MGFAYRLQEWLADRIQWVQYPRQRAVYRVRRLGLFENFPAGAVPRGLPQTRFDAYWSMFVLFGVFVLELLIAIPTLYCLSLLFLSITGLI